mgnify:CR=1 FL=1
MKIGIISDIHSNIYAFKACTEYMEKHKCDEYFFLGDYISDTPYTRETMDYLYEFMEKLPDALKPGGRVAILTFHSGEDKLVKKALKAGYKAGIYSDYAKDVIRPSMQECAQNGRARSTKMRWAVKAE